MITTKEIDMTFRLPKENLTVRKLISLTPTIASQMTTEAARLNMSLAEFIRNMYTEYYIPCNCIDKAEINADR
jgi:hypothetical protein